MIAYSYDDNGKYVGTYNCQLDPMATKREGYDVYLLPANATFEEPPDYDPETEISVWNGEAWTVEILADKTEPEPEPEPAQPTLDDRVTRLENAIEKGLTL